MRKSELLQELVRHAGTLSEIRLKQLYEIMEFFRKAANPQECRTLTDVEWLKMLLIIGILRLNDVEQLRHLHSLLI